MGLFIYDAEKKGTLKVEVVWPILDVSQNDGFPPPLSPFTRSPLSLKKAYSN